MKKREIKLSNIIPLIIILVCLINLCFSIYNITRWKIDSKKTEKQIEEINKLVKVEEVIEGVSFNDEADILEQKEQFDQAMNVPVIEIIEQKVEIPKENPYWDYIKMNLINVDFTQLKLKNPDTKGWIVVNGTNINYPFVQTSDNKYYLTHSFDKSYNNAGWVFLDYRNNIESLSKNTILYAHGRVDTTMFGSLKNILNSGWLNNTDNYVIKLSTEKENTLWQVFSVYHIPTTSDYIQVDFYSNEEFLSWANILLNRSFHDFNTSISENDKILTLSTCYNDKEKVVLHAKLIKKEER